MTTIRSRRARLAALAAIPVLLGALAACSDDPPGDKGPSRDAAAQWRLNYAECMRSHGIDVADPAANGNVKAAGPKDETPERQAATKACLDKLGPPPVQ